MLGTKFRVCRARRERDARCSSEVAACLTREAVDGQRVSDTHEEHGSHGRSEQVHSCLLHAPFPSTLHEITCVYRTRLFHEASAQARSSVSASPHMGAQAHAAPTRHYSSFAQKPLQLRFWLSAQVRMVDM